jgi:hypothetical protein
MVYELRDDVSFAETQYGIVLLDGNDGEYWTLNGTGAVVLRTLLGGGDSAQAAKALVREFDADPDTAAADVTQLVADLTSARLLRECG